MNEYPLIGIVIVTWNNANDIRECLMSLQEQDYPNLKVLIIDNASTDGTLRIVQEEFPKAEIIAREKNYFLSPSNNFGIKLFIEKYKTDYVMVLNPDTKASNNLVTQLVQSLENDKFAIAAGPKVIFYQNKFEGKINSAGLIYDGFKQAYDRGFEQDDAGQFNQQEYVFGVTGACIMFRISMLQEIGFYWERIKLYMDEVELFIRAKKKGFKVIYNPNTVVFHKWMQSSDQHKIQKINKIRNKAWLWIALRHYPLKSKLAMLKDYLFNRI